MIRLIFDLYASGEYSIPKIEKLLWKNGYRNRKGGMIKRTAIGHIIKSIKYRGYYVDNTVKIVNMFTKEQKILKGEDWVMWNDNSGETVPAIVSEKVWQKANIYFAKRSTNIKASSCSYKADNIFTGKIYCLEHSEPYYLRTRLNRKGENSATWVCKREIRNGSKICNYFLLKKV